MKNLDKDELMEIAEKLEAEMGQHDLLLAILLATPSDELQLTLEYINRCYEVGVKGI